MTFDQWYEDRFGIRVTQAERDNHKQLRHYRDCWGSALSCAKSDHEAALAAKDAAHEAALKAAVAAAYEDAAKVAEQATATLCGFDLDRARMAAANMDSIRHRIAYLIRARGAAHETN